MTPTPVIVPEQAKLPLAPVTVQPVAPEPPARSMVVAVVEPGPMVSAVAAPPMFNVVALVLNSVAVPVAVVVISAPTTSRSPARLVLPPARKVAMSVILERMPMLPPVVLI